MKILYFTRSNGDVDTYTITDNKPAEDIEKLSTKTLKEKARRVFIGDNAVNFAIVDSADLPRFPVWNGSTYITGDLYPDREKARDQIIESAVILFKGNFIKMDEFSRKQFSEVKDSLKRRNKKANWTVKNELTGEKLRVDISAEDIEKFEDALVDAINKLYVDADTIMPTNPFPLTVV